MNEMNTPSPAQLAAEEIRQISDITRHKDYMAQVEAIISKHFPEPTSSEEAWIVVKVRELKEDLDSRDYFDAGFVAGQNFPPQQPLPVSGETPRTNKQIVSGDHVSLAHLKDEFVRANFARELERELNDCRRTCNELVTDGNAVTLAENLQRKCAELATERAAREKAEQELDWQSNRNSGYPTKGGYEFYINEEWTGLATAALDADYGWHAALRKHRIDPDDERVRVRRVVEDDNLLKQAAESKSGDVAKLVEHFIDRADCAANNMEGAGGDDFIRFETRMVCAVETLERLGVKYDPITGMRAALASVPAEEVEEQLGEHELPCGENIKLPDVSVQTAGRHLLQIAKQQREIQRLQSLLSVPANPPQVDATRTGKH